MLSHPQNMELSPWTLGPSLEGDGREESRTLTQPRPSSLRKRGSRQHEYRFSGTLTPRQNKDSLPWMPDRGRA